jgi:hypothetical protein
MRPADWFQCRMGVEKIRSRGPGGGGMPHWNSIPKSPERDNDHPGEMYVEMLADRFIANFKRVRP